MTDKLYFGATTACHLNYQPNTFMRTQLLKNFIVLLCLGLAWCGAGFNAKAQIAIGSTGSTVDAFGSIPPASSWSTKSITGAGAIPESDAAMDQMVNGLTNAANTITAQLSSVTGDVPALNANGMWTSAGNIVTRPTGNAVTLVMATVTNVSGSTLQSFNVVYDYIQRLSNALVANEVIKGFRVYSSRTGAAGSWTPIGNFGNSFTTNVLQKIVIGVDVSAAPLTPDNAMYVLFADDNANINNDAVNTIDNFAIGLSPIITNHPQSVAASPGSSVTFSVGATGAKPLFYQWLKNSNNIPGQNSATLTLPNVGASDSGYYSVIVSNTFGVVTSSNALLSVQCNVPAGFTAQPNSQNLTAGNTLSLNVGTVGTTPITYQWLRNGAIIATATNATYTKVNAQSSDSGSYSVVINNCFDSPVTSQEAVISIAEASYTVVGLTNHFWRYANENTNIDLGDVWKAVVYPAESGWPQGRGMFGVENAAAIAPLINTPLVLNHAGGPNIVTHRMRTTFVLTNDLELVTLTFTNYVDDGSVVYLNGEQLFRYNMPNGTIGFMTSASGGGPIGGEGTYFVTNFPGTRFMSGTNTLAVEVHQSGTASSDVVMGMDVKVNYFVPTLLVITNQPQNTVTEETKSTTFTLGLQGAPAYYQWYKDGVAIPNATANPFVIPITTTNDAGSYYAVATNVINSVTSSIVTLMVSPDTNGPTLVDADGTIANTSVLVSFSERINAANAVNVTNYRITNTVSGTVLNINSATLQANGTNVLLNTDARASSANYILVVNRIRDISPRANVIATNSSIPIRSLVTIVDLGSGGWRFYNPNNFSPLGLDLGTTWRESNYTNDTAANGWGLNGFSIFWNGDETEIPGPVGSALAQRTTLTTYFRKFTSDLSFSPNGLKLSLSHVIDDGALLYLNGAEIFRFNMPQGTINYQTPASSQINPVALVGPIDISNVGFLQGTNLIAAELHTRAGADVDKYFGIELEASVQSYAVGPVLITGGPANVTASEGSSHTFNATVVGALTFQWRQNGTNLAGQTNSVLTITNIPLTYSGYTYSLLATGASGAFATSTNAVLTVIGDTNAPTLLSAYLTNASTVLVSFSESMASAFANAVTNYTVTNAAGQTQQLSSAVLNNQTVTLTTASPLPAGAYFLTVRNLRDASTLGNVINPNPSTLKIGYQAPLITFSNAWRFNDENLDFGTGFAAPSYNDSTWGLSNALFAAKNGVIPAQPLPVNTILTRTNNGSDVKTYYFRTRVNSLISGSGTLAFRTVLDDGCIIYFNGVEVYRLGMGPGADALALLANRTVGESEMEGPFSVPVTNIVAGENVIAVSVHEAAAGSSDMYWAGEFSLAVSSGTTSAPRPLQIVTQPRSRTNAVGSAASLYVTATGEPTLTYQWRRNGTNLVGQTSSTIIFNPVQTTDAGNYTVVVSNLFSSLTSSVATVTVTNGSGGCTPISFTKPLLTMVVTNNGANVLLYWTNSITNSCGDRFPYMLQQTLVLSNSSATTPWSNITTSSPVVLPKTNNMRFFRLFGP